MVIKITVPSPPLLMAGEAHRRSPHPQQRAIPITIKGPKKQSTSPEDEALTAGNQSSIYKHWQWWLMVPLCAFASLSGQTIGILLGRFYYNQGGTSMWMATLVQSAGSSLLLISFFLFPSSQHHTQTIPRPPLLKMVLIYITIGLIIASDNLMYSYGLLYLPVSTYSLVCATQLAFNAVFSYFLNSQKFTMLIFNSVVLLTFSAALLGVHSDSDNSNIPKGKYPLGFVLTLGGSATFSLILSLIQRTFQKIIKRETFSVVLELQICTNIVASLASVVGLFASGDWGRLSNEMEGFEKGKVSYVMTLVGTAVARQVSSVGTLGLIFLMSSLFSNVINTLSLPLVPVFAVVFFPDKMDGVKVMALLIAIWGFLNYVYQHHVDNSKEKGGKRSESL